MKAWDRVIERAFEVDEEDPFFWWTQEDEGEKSVSPRFLANTGAEWNRIINQAFDIDEEDPFFWWTQEEPGERSVSPRYLGGPGSGNFGHAGRPGEVGGSAPSEDIYQQRLDFPDDVPHITTREFAQRLREKGYKAVEFKRELSPSDVRDLEIEGSADLPEPALEGVIEGLDVIRQEAPGLHQMIQTIVPIGNFNYGGETKGSEAVTSRNEKGVTILFNGQTGKDWKRIQTEENGVAAKLARGLTGDDAARQLYRGIAIHESGHVADLAMDNVISGSLSYELTKNLNGDANAIHQLLHDKVSPYAASSPHEAAAEVFTMVISKRPLPKELVRTERLIKDLLRMPYASRK